MILDRTEAASGSNRIERLKLERIISGFKIRRKEHLDERKIISSVISNIENAKTEIEALINDNPNTNLDNAYRSLNDCVSHCHAIFGPSTPESLRIRERKGNRNG